MELPGRRVPGPPALTLPSDQALTSGPHKRRPSGTGSYTLGSCPQEVSLSLPKRSSEATAPGSSARQESAAGRSAVRWRPTQAGGQSAHPAVRPQVWATCLVGWGCAAMWLRPAEAWDWLSEQRVSGESRHLARAPAHTRGPLMLQPPVLVWTRGCGGNQTGGAWSTRRDGLGRGLPAGLPFRATESPVCVCLLLSAHGLLQVYQRLGHLPRG